MYLLSLRLAPSPWVGTRSSGTAQYTVPSVSTQTVTPRRVGFLACAWAPPRAEPAGPSVWCTMMLRQGWDFATSPHGASQTIFRPGISGVPDARAIAARSGVWADAGKTTTAQTTAVSSRKIIFFSPGPSPDTPLATTLRRSCAAPAPAVLHNPVPAAATPLHGRRNGCGVSLGFVQRMIGGRDQPVGECAHLGGPLRHPDRYLDRNIDADALLGVRAAHRQDAAGDHRAFARARGWQHHAELVAAATRQQVAGPQARLRHQREMLQAGVAGGMTAGVVDAF